jgi:hypothetical protein
MLALEGRIVTGKDFDFITARRSIALHVDEVLGEEACYLFLSSNMIN